MHSLGVPAFIIYGIDGSLPAEVGAVIAQRHEAELIVIDTLLDDVFGRSSADIVISSGDQALQNAQLAIWRWINSQEDEASVGECDAELSEKDFHISTDFPVPVVHNAVIVLPGSLLDNESVVAQLHDFQQCGSQLVHTTAELNTVVKRLGFNRPRAVALGPARMMLATRIREREEYWSRVLDSDHRIDTSQGIPEW